MGDGRVAAGKTLPQERHGRLKGWAKDAEVRFRRRRTAEVDPQVSLPADKESDGDKVANEYRRPKSIAYGGRPDRERTFPRTRHERARGHRDRQREIGLAGEHGKRHTNEVDEGAASKKAR